MTTTFPVRIFNSLHRARLSFARGGERFVCLPDTQYGSYRWLTPEQLLASDNVHENRKPGLLLLTRRRWAYEDPGSWH